MSPIDNGWQNISFVPVTMIQRVVQGVVKFVLPAVNRMASSLIVT